MKKELPKNYIHQVKKYVSFPWESKSNISSACSSSSLFGPGFGENKPTPVLALPSPSRPRIIQEGYLRMLRVGETTLPGDEVREGAYGAWAKCPGGMKVKIENTFRRHVSPPALPVKFSINDRPIDSGFDSPPSNPNA